MNALSVFSHSLGQPLPFALGFFDLNSWSVVPYIPALPRLDSQSGSSVPKAVLAIHLNVMRFVTSFPAPGLRACDDPRQSAPSIGS